MANIIDIVVRAKDATAGAWQSVKSQADKLATGLKNGLQGAARFAKTAAIAIAVVGTAAVAAAGKAIAAYKIQAESEEKLAAVLKATGFAAGKTSSELKKHAAVLQGITGIGDEVIISMQAMLATFRNIKGDEFDRATTAALDMGAAMKKSGKSAAEVEGAAIMLGKALNDPVGRLGDLSRVGVTFTDQQKQQIKAMAEANDMAGAQAIILEELESEFGGTAEAMGKASHGVDQMKASFGDAVEAIGKAIVETDGFDSVISRITKALQNLSESGYIELWAENVRSAIAFISPALEGIGKAFRKTVEAIQSEAAFLGALSGGATIKDALDAGNAAPESAKKEKEARLAEIRAKRDAKEAEKDAAERREMEAAKEENAKARANKEIDDWFKADDAAKEKKNAANKKDFEDAFEKNLANQAKLTAQKEKDLIKLASIDDKLLKAADQARIASWTNAANVHEKNIANLKDKLAGVVVGKEARRAKKLEAQDANKEERRAKELEGRVGRGVKLGEDDAAFLEQRKLQKEIKEAEQKKLIADQNAQILRDMIAQEQHDETITELKLTRTVLERNLQVGA